MRTDIKNIAVTLAAAGSVSCAGYDTNQKPALRWESQVADVDDIIRFKDEHGCIGLAKTSDQAKESYRFLCSRYQAGSPEKLEVSKIGDLAVAYGR